MNKHALRDALCVLALTSPLTTAADPCLQSLQSAGIPWPGANFNSGVLIIEQSAASLTGAIRDGADQWNNCPNTSEETPNFPYLVLPGNEDPNHVDIRIKRVSGLGPPAEGGTGGTACGAYTTGSRTISLYTRTKDKYGDEWNCPTSNAVIADIVAHELGHFLGLNNVPGSCGLVNIMGPLNEIQSGQGMQPTYNAISRVTEVVCEFADEQSTPPHEGGGNGSPGEPNNDDCNCPPSPIIISVYDSNYELTSLANGVHFDIDADGEPELIAWTDAASDEAFLSFDLNGNGIIDDGTELFGNYTEQPPSGDPNGFLALAEWDSPTNGGNDDGLIDSSDDVFDFLRLWIDMNHNGFSEPIELFYLEDFRIQYIDLDFHESKTTDRHGNQFRFKSEVGRQHGNVLAWDVFFVQK